MSARSLSPAVQQAIRQQLQRFVIQVSTGCGKNGCRNEDCVTGGAQALSGTDTITKAKQLVQKGASPCVAPFSNANAVGTNANPSVATHSNSVSSSTPAKPQILPKSFGADELLAAKEALLYIPPTSEISTRTIHNSAVSLSYLQKFASSPLVDPNWCTAEVNLNLILPLTSTNAAVHTRFTDGLADELVGTPTYFISHWWGANFAGMVHLLCAYLTALHPGESLEQVYVWFDLFAISQHSKTEEQRQRKREQLKDISAVVSSAKQGTLVLFDEGGRVLTRIWCLLEIFDTVSHQQSTELSLTAIVPPTIDVNELRKMWTALDVETAQATREEDLRLILARFRESQLGFHELNHRIKRAIVRAGSKRVELFKAKLQGHDASPQDKTMLAQLLGIEATLHYTAGNVQESLECLNEAFQLMGVSLDSSAPLFQPPADEGRKFDHALVGRLYMMMGHAQQDLGAFVPARNWHRKAVEAVEKRVGSKDDLELAALYNSLGVVHHELEELEAALACYEKGRHISEMHLGKDHPTLSVDKVNIGAVLRSMGDLEKAHEILKEAVSSCEQHYGRDHPTTAGALNSLGGVLSDMGEFDAALVHYQAALDRRKKVLDKAHPELLRSYVNIAVTLGMLGRIPLALETVENALSLAIEKFGEFNPEVASCYRCIGHLRLRSGDLDNALAAHVQSLAILTTIVGEDAASEDIAQSLNDISQVYFRQNNLEEAMPYLERSLKMREQVLGPLNPKLGDSLENMAIANFKSGQPDRAILYMQRLIQLHISIHGAMHPAVAGDQYNLAQMLLRIGPATLAQAKQAALSCLECHRSCQLPYSHEELPHPIEQLMNLASLLAQRDQVTEALKLAEGALQLAIQQNHPLGPVAKRLVQRIESHPMKTIASSASTAGPSLQRYLNVQEGSDLLQNCDRTLEKLQVQYNELPKRADSSTGGAVETWCLFYLTVCRDRSKLFSKMGRHAEAQDAAVDGLVRHAKCLPLFAPSNGRDIGNIEIAQLHFQLYVCLVNGAAGNGEDFAAFQAADKAIQLIRHRTQQDQQKLAAVLSELDTLRKKLAAFTIDLVELSALPTISVYDGFACDGCGVSPIIGECWTCNQCESSVDLCAFCYRFYPAHSIIQNSLPEAHILSDSRCLSSQMNAINRAEHIFSKRAAKPTDAPQFVADIYRNSLQPMKERLSQQTQKVLKYKSIDPKLNQLQMEDGSIISMAEFQQRARIVSQTISSQHPSIPEHSKRLVAWQRFQKALQSFQSPSTQVLSTHNMIFNDCSCFFFIPASMLLDPTLTTFPIYRTIKHALVPFQREHSLVRRRIFVSHRWMTAKHPDPAGDQFRRLQQSIRADIEKEENFVVPGHLTEDLYWIDFSCLPQGEDRDNEERELFTASLLRLQDLLLQCNRMVIVRSVDDNFVHSAWCFVELFVGVLTDHQRDMLLPSSLSASHRSDEIEKSAMGEYQYMLNLIHGVAVGDVEESFHLQQLRVTNGKDWQPIQRVFNMFREMLHRSIINAFIRLVNEHEASREFFPYGVDFLCEHIYSHVLVRRLNAWCENLNGPVKIRELALVSRLKELLNSAAMQIAVAPTTSQPKFSVANFAPCAVWLKINVDASAEVVVDLRVLTSGPLQPLLNEKQRRTLQALEDNSDHHLRSLAQVIHLLVDSGAP